MRLNGTLSYLLGDHLGSTSITTNASGAKIAEMRYTAWGEVRYNWGSTPTDYTYTGQYSNVPEFGLYYYNARWYDGQLGRFAQADTVVQGDNRKSNNTIAGVAETQYVPLTVQYSGEPAILNKLNADNAFLLSKGGLRNLSKEDRQKAKIAGVPLETQVLDRYTYSLNNPVKYNDPTGYDSGGNDDIGYKSFSPTFSGGTLYHLWYFEVEMYVMLTPETVDFINNFKNYARDYANSQEARDNSRYGIVGGSLGLVFGIVTGVACWGTQVFFGGMNIPGWAIGISAFAVAGGSGIAAYGSWKQRQAAIKSMEIARRNAELYFGYLIPYAGTYRYRLGYKRH